MTPCISRFAMSRFNAFDNPHPKIVLLIHLSIGFFGESIPYESSLTSVVKAHGHYSSSELYHTDPLTQPQDTFAQMTFLKGNAILLIRNPYWTLFGYRNYNSGGHFSHADKNNFTENGNS